MSFYEHPDIQEILLREQAKGEAKNWDAELAEIRKSLNTQFNGPSSVDQIQAERQRATALEREANDFLRSVERDRTAQMLEQTVPRSSPSADATRARQAQADQQAAEFRRELQRNQAPIWEEWNAPEPGTPARSPRVSRPSGGGLPPSPRTGGQPIYPVDDPLTIRTGEPRQSFPIPDTPNARPSSLPQPVPRGPSGPSMSYPIGAGAAGAVAGAVAGGALGIATGAPPGQAIGGAVGGAVGGVGGAVIGGTIGSFLGGPVGTAIGANVGGVVGGFIGGGIGSALGGMFGGPAPAQLPPPPAGGIVRPFSGGQSRTLYRVYVRYSVGSSISEGVVETYGPIRGTEAISSALGSQTFLLASDASGNLIKHQLSATSYADPNAFASIQGVDRLDGAPDTGGDPPGSPAPSLNIPSGRGSYLFDGPPGALPAGTPNARGAPRAGPTGLPNGGSPRGDSPDWVKGGGLAPGSGHPSGNRPGPLGPGMPETAPPPATKPDTNPNNPDKRQPGPSSGGGSFPDPSSPAWLIPVAATQLLAPRPTPTGFRTRHPGAEPEVPPTPDLTASPCRGNGCGGANLAQSRRNSAQLGGIQSQLGGLQAQLTGLGIGADAAANAAILARLDALDAKLGPQIPGGGIGNFIKKTWDFLQIDRVLSVLTYITVLHNAYFLSSSLAQTLFSAIGNSLAVFGITNAEGQPLEVGSIVSKWTDGFFKSIFGVQQVEGFKAGWRKFNNIFRAASNVVSSMQSLFYSVQSILEIIGQNVSKIGNALKAWGSVSDRAYGWMSENSSKTGILGAFDRVRDKTQAIEEITSNIDGVASEVLGARETLAEFEKQTEELQKLQREGLPKPQIENLPIKQANDAAKAVSQAPAIATADLVKPEV